MGQQTLLLRVAGTSRQAEGEKLRSNFNSHSESDVPKLTAGAMILSPLLNSDTSAQLSALCLAFILVTSLGR